MAGAGSGAVAAPPPSARPVHAAPRLAAAPQHRESDCMPHVAKTLPIAPPGVDVQPYVAVCSSSALRCGLPAPLLRRTSQWDRCMCSAQCLRSSSPTWGLAKRGSSARTPSSTLGRGSCQVSAEAWSHCSKHRADLWNVQTSDGTVHAADMGFLLPCRSAECRRN